jgi:tetratricopeptide (TPR) repeat protein
MVPALCHFPEDSYGGLRRSFYLGGRMMQIENAAQQALSWADVEKLSDPETAQGDRHAIVRRLVAQAARNLGETLSRNPIPQVDEEAYDEPLRRAVARTRQAQERLMQERRDAGRLWALLESHPPARRRILIRNDRRFQTWGLYDCLRERFQILLEREPKAAVEAAELILAAAQGLSPAAYGEESVRDFQGQALIALGTARRVAGDLEGARMALDQAAAILAMGSGDLLEKAESESARAALLRDLGQPEAAEIAGRRAVRLAHRVGGSRVPAGPGLLEDTDVHLRQRRRASISGFRPRQH